MHDKIAISAYVLKIVEKDPFLRLQMRAKEENLIVTNFFSTNKQYVKIKLVQNDLNSLNFPTLTQIFWAKSLTFRDLFQIP